MQTGVIRATQQGPGRSTAEVVFIKSLSDFLLLLRLKLLTAEIAENCSRGRRGNRARFSACYHRKRMRTLFIGDIFGRPGRTIVRDRLKGIVRDHGVDLVLANGENAAAGCGLTPALAED